MQFTKKDTNLIKGVAIIMMIFHHCFLGADRYAGYDISFGILGEYYTVMLSSFCKICVSIFVFLSGYGITISLSKINMSNPSELKSQVTKRYFSMMSGFWFIYIISVVATCFLNSSYLSLYKGKRLIDSLFFGFCDFLGLANLFGTPTLNGTWWYMSLAIIIVASMPIFYAIYKKYGSIVIIILTFCACGMFAQKNVDMTRWLFTLVLGMISADKNLLVAFKQIKIIKNSKYIEWILRFLIGTVFVIACVYVRQKIDWTVSYLRDGIIPMYIIVYCYTFLSDIPVLKNVLIYLGKHSMNIFLTHTFIRYHFFGDFTYSFKYPVLIVAVLLGVSLVLSICIDALKKYTGYDKLTAFVIKKAS